jgi:hypothetical protein
MLTEAQVQQFKQDGYLRGGRVVGDDTVGVLQEEIARVIRDVDKGVPLGRAEMTTRVPLERRAQTDQR